MPYKRRSPLPRAAIDPTRALLHGLEQLQSIDRDLEALSTSGKVPECREAISQSRDEVREAIACIRECMHSGDAD